MNPLQNFGALAGNMQMTGAGLAGRAAGQDRRMNFMETLMGNMMRAAQAQQEQANWQAQFSRQGDWKREESSFRDKAFGADQSWKRQAMDRDQTRYAADEAWKTRLFDRDEARYANPFQPQSRFLESLGIAGQDQLPFLFPQMAGRQTSTDKNAAKSLNSLLYSSLDDTGMAQPGALAGFFGAAMSADRRASDPYRLAAESAANSLGFQAGVPGLAQNAVADIGNAAHYAKKLAAMRDEWWTSGKDIKRYADNEQKFIDAANALMAYAQNTGDASFRDQAEKMMKDMDYFNRNYAEKISKSRDAQYGTKRLADDLMSGKVNPGDFLSFAEQTPYMDLSVIGGMPGM